MKEGEGELWPCIVVVTCVVLRRMADGVRTLILKRAETEKEGPGLWTIPGGKLKWDDVGVIGGDRDGDIGTDIFMHGILREIEEETGIAKNMVYPIILPQREKVFRRKDGTLTLVLVFWTEQYHSPDVKTDEGATEYRWVSEFELDSYTFIGNVRADIKVAFQAFFDRERESRRPYVCGMDK